MNQSAAQQDGGGDGPPAMSLDQILWLGLGSNPGKMLTWSMFGSACVALVVTKIIADTVKYYDHYGRDDSKLAAGIAAGTTLAWLHFPLTCAQTFKLAQYAFTDFASIVLFDIYCNTASNFIGGSFALFATCYYTTQVWKLSREKGWIIVGLGTLATGTFVMTTAVAITGFKAPKTLDMVTVQEFRAFNHGRIPYFKAWAILSMLTDASVWVATTYYLLRTLLFGTMFPPFFFLIILVATTESKTVDIGDYRRAVGNLVTPLYYLSPLHSLVARIDIRQSIDEEDETTELTEMPASSNTNANSSGKGKNSTVHIDPLQGKSPYPASRGVYFKSQSQRGEGSHSGASQLNVPCKTTFGEIESFGKLDSPSGEVYMTRKQEKSTTSRPTSEGSKHHVPSKKTFGATETFQEVDRRDYAYPDAALGPMRF